MYTNIKLAEIMTSDLVTVEGNDTMDKVDDIFRNNDFHHVPVVNKSGELLGIISKSDFLLMCDSMTIFRKEHEHAQNLRFFKSLLAKEVMVHQVAKLKPDNTVMQAASLFKENLFHAIPIVNDDRKLVGIVTTFDLINYAYQEPAFLSK